MYLQNQQPPCVAWELVRSGGSLVCPLESTPRSGAEGWRLRCTWWTDSRPPPPRAGWDLTLSPPTNTVSNVKPVSLQWNKKGPCRHLLIIQVCVSNFKSKRSITSKEKWVWHWTIHIKWVQCEKFFPICKLIIVHVS